MTKFPVYCAWNTRKFLRDASGDALINAQGERIVDPSAPNGGRSSNKIGLNVPAEFPDTLPDVLTAKSVANLAKAVGIGEMVIQDKEYVLSPKFTGEESTDKAGRQVITYYYSVPMDAVDIELG